MNTRSVTILIDKCINIRKYEIYEYMNFIS